MFVNAIEDGEKGFSRSPAARKPFNLKREKFSGALGWRSRPFSDLRQLAASAGSEHDTARQIPVQQLAYCRE
jgi:hypothetical protein